MDEQTIKFYSNNTEALAGKYGASDCGISEYFSEAFSARDKVIDIGCAAGRDLSFHKIQ